MRLKLIIAFAVLATALGVYLFEENISEPDMDDPVIQQLIEQLAAEGYEVLVIESTLLGRLKVEAHSEKFEREIVLAPGAGTFLRDEISPLEEDDTDDD